MFAQVLKIFQVGCDQQVPAEEEIQVEGQGYHDFNRQLYGWSAKVEVALWSFLMAGPWNHNGIP